MSDPIADIKKRIQELAMIPEPWDWQIKISSEIRAIEAQLLYPRPLGDNVGPRQKSEADFLTSIPDDDCEEEGMGLTGPINADVITTDTTCPICAKTHPIRERIALQNRAYLQAQRVIKAKDNLFKSILSLTDLARKAIDLANGVEPRTRRSPAQYRANVLYVARLRQESIAKCIVNLKGQGEAMGRLTAARNGARTEITRLEEEIAVILRCHPRCSYCGILVGEGHAMNEYRVFRGMVYCNTCKRIPQVGVKTKKKSLSGVV